MKRTLGTCYYPEHWPEDQWPDDARRMKKAGLSWVRIGEFAWARLEPEPDKLCFEWLDRAIEVLAEAGLQIVLCTPTATPPRWMLNKHPDILPKDAQGRLRNFGSRRHYCFSHQGYHEECRRIAGVLAERYGQDDRIAAWQIDNEYGCHDTTLSYSDAARVAFRIWLAERYPSIDALNESWGNVFWSMEYAAFDDVDLPNLTVTEPNPAHVHAFRSFSSDQVAKFNAIQVDELRKWTDAPLIHNYMGRVLDFDHYEIGAGLDIASWDSYPLGFLLDRIEKNEQARADFLRQGDPDFQAFHHDLYRAVGSGRWWVMEQQPGPVNWAPWNPAPLPGMVRLWTWEAFAHGAEVVSYFRWKQVPFAQEQMHTGLLRADGTAAPVLAEIAQVASEIEAMPKVETASAPAAIVFDYVSQWAWEAQPHGRDFDYFDLVFSAYRALRRQGISVDILPPDCSNLSPYKLVLVPGLMTLSDGLRTAIEETAAQVILGPRFNSRTADFRIVDRLSATVETIDVDVVMTESLPPDARINVSSGGAVIKWWEHLEGNAPVSVRTAQDAPVLVGDRVQYLAGWPDDALWDHLMAEWLDTARIDRIELTGGLRIRDTETHRFVFNYGPDYECFKDEEIVPGGVTWRPRS